jgi:hypothetical protein
MAAAIDVHSKICGALLSGALIIAEHQRKKMRAPRIKTKTRHNNQNGGFLLKR